MKSTTEETKATKATETTEDKAPVNIEVTAPTEEPTPAPEAKEKEVVETDVRKKLGRKTDDDSNPFVPAVSAQVEADAKRFAEEKGFELNRGNSVGARLLARSQNRNK